MKTTPGVAVAASLALALGGCAEADPGMREGGGTTLEYDEDNLVYKSPEEMVVSDARERQLRNIYAGIVKWGGGKVTAKLVMVRGREEFVCTQAGATKYMITSLNPSTYCAQPNAVFVTGAWVDDIASKHDPHNEGIEVAADTWLLWHEWAHSQEELTFAWNDTVDDVTEELRADCVAGRGVAEGVRKKRYKPEIIKNIGIVLQKLPEDAAHSTNKRREDSFQHGMAGGDCSEIIA